MSAAEAVPALSAPLKAPVHSGVPAEANVLCRQNAQIPLEAAAETQETGTICTSTHTQAEGAAGMTGDIRSRRISQRLNNITWMNHCRHAARLTPAFLTYVHKENGQLSGWV